MLSLIVHRSVWASAEFLIIGEPRFSSACKHEFQLRCNKQTQTFLQMLLCFSADNDSDFSVPLERSPRMLSVNATHKCSRAKNPTLFMDLDPSAQPALWSKTGQTPECGRICWLTLGICYVTTMLCRPVW